MNAPRPGLRTFAVAGGVFAAAAAFAAVGGATTTAGTPPTNSNPPTISGTASQGSTLAASSGSWAGTTPIAYAYLWQRCDSAGAACASIAGATRQTYVIGAADVGHKLRVAVTARNSAGTGTADSATTAAVTGATPPSNTVAPAISGSAAVGWTLSTSNGTWTGTAPITFTYQWQRCDSGGANCVAISRATARTYEVTTSDTGHRLRAAVTGTNVGGSAEGTSGASNVVAVTAPGATTAPAITGTTTQGQTLTVSNGEWIGAGPITYTYAWDRCDSSGNNCVAISGATSRTYVLTSSDTGHKIVAVVTAKNSAGSNHANSNTVGPVGSTTPTPPPPPSGTVKLPNGETSIAASSVPDTDRLTISSVKVSPSAIVGRAPVTMTFKILDANKYDVSGALVYVIGLPYGWAPKMAEAATAADGTVSISVAVTKNAPKKGALVLFVRARTPKGDLLAGSSTRRLVQVKIKP